MLNSNIGYFTEVFGGDGKRQLIESLGRYKALAPVTIDGVAHPRAVKPA